MGRVLSGWRLLALSLGLAACEEGHAVFECHLDGEVKAVASYTLSCDEYKTVGDQLLDQARRSCSDMAASDRACDCAYLEITCRGGDSDD